jgi:hypothetical protein
MWLDDTEIRIGMALLEGGRRLERGNLQVFFRKNFETP